MREPITVEVCVDSAASALAAERGGARRIELCSDLLEGGVTPSLGLLAVVRSKLSIGMHTIIRPRPGDFCYSAAEFEIMQRDIEYAKVEGAQGVVLGILEPDGSVDVRRTRQLIDRARPMSVTFHRAFDLSADLFRSLGDVCETGADRILTSGGAQSCMEGMETLARLVERANERVRIMAGGRIGMRDAATIIEQTGVTEIHVGLATPVTNSTIHDNSHRVSLSKAKGEEFSPTEVREENVRELIQAISNASKQ